MAKYKIYRFNYRSVCSSVCALREGGSVDTERCRWMAARCWEGQCEGPGAGRAGPRRGLGGGGQHLRRTDPVFGLSVSVPEALGREPSAENWRGPWGQGAGLRCIRGDTIRAQVQEHCGRDRAVTRTNRGHHLKRRGRCSVANVFPGWFFAFCLCWGWGHCSSR